MWCSPCSQVACLLDVNLFPLKLWNRSPGRPELVSPRTEGEPVRVRCVLHCRWVEHLYSLRCTSLLYLHHTYFDVGHRAWSQACWVLMNVYYINDLLRRKTNLRNSPVLPKRERCVQTRGHWNSLPFLFSPFQNWMIRTPLWTKSDLVQSLPSSVVILRERIVSLLRVPQRRPTI